MLKMEPYIDLVIGPQFYHKINDKILEYIQKKFGTHKLSSFPNIKFYNIINYGVGNPIISNT